MRYNKTHEWARLDDTGMVVIGISEHAAAQLGDVIFVELPKLNNSYAANAEIAVVESVKAASDIYAPVSGKVKSVNKELGENPQLVNESPEDKGWLFKMQPDNPKDIDALLDKKAYDAFCVE
jgi:glycine cleavage system H protein